ncbi:MAG: DUF4153 domain-containing protein [Planctomycetota bacterium]|jgi:hypothetical protein
MSTGIWRTISVLLLPIGAVLAIIATAWHQAPLASKEFWWGQGLVGMVMMLVAAYSGYKGWAVKYEDSDEKTTRERMFNHYLMVTGYALLLVGVLCCTLVAGLLYSGRLEGSADGFQSNISGNTLAILVVLSAVASVFGALFFVANSLRKKREDPKEEFSVRKFWGGLTFRLGEAVLFSLVIFWLIWWSSAPTTGTITQPAQSPANMPLGYALLPLMSLLLGMFVTSGEKLVFAIAQGLFRAVEAFFTPK